MQILTHPRHGENVGRIERAASVLGGAVLTMSGMRTRGAGGIALAVAGAELMRRGFTGTCYAYSLLGISTAPSGERASLPYTTGIRVDASTVINRPVSEVYRFWRQLENLPRFMQHLDSVTVLDGKRSRWAAKGPGGRTVEWEAEIVNKVENRLIGWRSLPGSTVQNAGSVQFREAAGGGTEIRVELQYNPPAGMLGAYVAQLFGEEPTQQIEEDLNRLKQVLETQETPVGL